MPLYKVDGWMQVSDTVWASDEHEARQMFVVRLHEQCEAPVKVASVREMEEPLPVEEP